VQDVEMVKLGKLPDFREERAYGFRMFAFGDIAVDCRIRLVREVHA
jgi:hypothetical protein